MCAILGMLVSEAIENQDFERFAHALNTMVSRGPDDAGTVALSVTGNSYSMSVSGHDVSKSGKGRTVGLLGHRRLSIIDLSQAGHQPMRSNNGRLWITFNGEVFNYIELREELVKLGYFFNTQTDTEVILVAYQEWGVECFKRFNGMWGIAIVDLDGQTVCLSRDHFGIKPVYYVQNQQGFCFGSTIKSVLELSQIPRRANAPVLYDFLVSGRHTCGSETYFEGVHEVPAAHFLVFSLRQPNAAPQTKRWWRIGQNRIDTDDPYNTFVELFEDAIKIRLRSDVRVGSCLSGGLDSSAIVMAMASQLSGRPVETITCCYDGAGFDEQPFARQVVLAAGCNAHWPTPQKTHRLSDDLEHLVAGQEKPFASLSIYSQYCVMREAKKAGITVLLDGQGGDELFLGYDFCHMARLNFMIRSGQLGKALRFSGQICRNNSLFTPKKILVGLAANLIPRPGRNRKSIPAQKFLNNDFARLHRNQSKPGPFYDDLNDYRYSLVEGAPLPPLLHHEDRNSMAFSIESRLPLLDYRLADFVFNLSPDILMKEGWSKVFLRRYIDKTNLSAVAWRREKMGYNTPSSNLMEHSRPFFKDVFSQALHSGRFIQSQRLKVLLHSEKLQDWHWRLLSVELWMQSFKVS